MARTAAGAALTASHAQLQRMLGAQVLAQLLRLWPGVSTSRPATFDLFGEAASLLVLEGFRQSAGLAAAYFAGFRVAEGVAGQAPAALAPLPSADRVRELLRAAAVVGILRARDAGRTAAAERDQGWVKLAGQATSLVLGGGRQTTLLAVSADREVRGYQRVTGSPCAFCAMLASRGAVYTTDFEAHDHCACSVEPVYAGSRMPARSEEYLELWERSTAGLSGGDAFNAFRRALEAPEPEAIAA